MKKFFLVLISSTLLCARNIPEEVGKRTPTFKRLNSLRHEDERVDYGNFVLKLEEARIRKNEGDTKWLEAFDKATELLKKIQYNKSLECRNLALQAAQEKNYETLWQERHSFWGTIDANLGTIAAHAPTLLQTAQAAGNLLELKEKFHNHPETFHNVTFIEEETNRSGKMGHRVIVAVSQGSQTRAIKTNATLLHAFPSKTDFCKIAVFGIGQSFKPKDLAAGERKQFIPLAAAATALVFGWNIPNLGTPLISALFNGTIVSKGAWELGSLTQHLYSEWGKECPLSKMHADLEADKKLAEEHAQSNNETPTIKIPGLDTASLLKGFPQRNPQEEEEEEEEEEKTAAE